MRWAEFIFSKFCGLTGVSFRRKQPLNDLDELRGSPALQNGVFRAHVWKIGRLYGDGRLFVKSEIAEPVLSKARVTNCLALDAVI
jgi:hypothetical protein